MRRGIRDRLRVRRAQGTLTLTDEGKVYAEHFSEVDYSLYAGGWEKKHFAQEVYDESGKKIQYPDALASFLAD